VTEYGRLAEPVAALRKMMSVLSAAGTPNAVSDRRCPCRAQGADDVMALWVCGRWLLGAVAGCGDDVLSSLTHPRLFSTAAAPPPYPSTLPTTPCPCPSTAACLSCLSVRLLLVSVLSRLVLS